MIHGTKVMSLSLRTCPTMKETEVIIRTRPFNDRHRCPAIQLLHRLPDSSVQQSRVLRRPRLDVSWDDLPWADQIGMKTWYHPTLLPHFRAYASSGVNDDEVTLSAIDHHSTTITTLSTVFSIRHVIASSSTCDLQGRSPTIYSICRL